MVLKVKAGAKAKAKAAERQQQLGPGGGWACGLLREQKLLDSRVRTPGGRGEVVYPSTA